MLKFIVILVSFSTSGLIRDVAIDSTAGQTVWWRTAGAIVMGFTDRSACSLFLYGTGRSVIVSWHANAGESLGFNDPDLKFRDGDMPAVVEVGNAWVGSPTHPLIGRSIENFVSIQLPQPIDPLLIAADHISLHSPTGDSRFEIDHSKMPALLGAVQRCRTLMKH